MEKREKKKKKKKEGSKREQATAMEAMHKRSPCSEGGDIGTEDIEWGPLDPCRAQRQEWVADSDLLFSPCDG